MITSRLATMASVSLVLTGCAGLIPSQQGPAPVSQSSASTVSAGNSSNQEVVQALSDVQNLRVEIRELRDRVERQEFELDRLNNRQRDLYDDLDQRLRAQERTGSTPSIGQSSPSMQGQQNVPTLGGSSGNLPPTAQGTNGSAAGQSGFGQSGTGSSSGITLGSVQGQGQAMGNGAQPSASTTAPGQVAIVQPRMDNGAAGVSGNSGPVSVSAQEAYDQAFGLLKQSRYSDAIQAFEAFIRDYPNTDLTDDAYYWLAEARYVTREFEAALNGFRTVTTNFSDSQRVPASYLKIGYIQYEIGAYADARETLSYIMKNFPTHRVAVSAETRLKKMDREGR